MDNLLLSLHAHTKIYSERGSMPLPSCSGFWKRNCLEIIKWLIGIIYGQLPLNIQTNTKIYS